MQTFLTSLDLEQSAYSLWENGVSGNRLQNQINEGLIILRTLTGWYTERERKGWPHHPATKMWRGYEAYLTNYIFTHIEVYEELSGNDCEKRFNDVYDAGVGYSLFKGSPHWLTEEFAGNHRSVLLGKALEKLESFEDGSEWTKKKLTQYHKALKVVQWYQSLEWTEQPAVKVKKNGRLVWPYIWPVTEK